MEGFTHFIDEDNTYKILSDGKCVFSISLFPEYQAVKITTPNEIWEGPISFVNLTADIDCNKKDN